MIYDQDETSLITDDIAEKILQEYKMDFVVQKLVNQGKALRKLNPNSFNTFRLITYVYKGKIKHTPGIVMIASKDSRYSNAKEFLTIGINDEGKLNSYAINKDSINGEKEIEIHPTSGCVFKECYIPEYPKVIEAAKRVHKYVPRVGIINWDFMIDDQGDPVLIEANSRNGNGVFLIQSAQGKPVFGEDTESIMRWIRKMDKVGKSQRYRKRMHL